MLDPITSHRSRVFPTSLAVIVRNERTVCPARFPLKRRNDGLLDDRDRLNAITICSETRLIERVHAPRDW